MRSASTPQVSKHARSDVNQRLISRRRELGKTPDLSIAAPVNADERVVYSGARTRVVYTSGRTSGDGWHRLRRTLRYRFRCNLRMLPVSTNAAQSTGRDHDPVRRYVDNRPVRTENGKRDIKN